MLRSIFAVVAGFALWSTLWLGGDQVHRKVWPDAYPPDFPQAPMTAVVPLLAVLALSVVCSWLAGLVTARLAPAGRTGPVWVLALVLLGVGVAVQAGVWEALPLWYHVPFLALLVPVTWLGGRAGRARRA